MKPILPTGVRKLVEERIRQATLVGEMNEARHVRATTVWPVIAISREPCAGGTTIGRTVAARMGFACWDQQLLTRIASESGAFESILASVDERVSSRVSDFVRSLLVGFEYAQDEYRLVLTKVVGAIAAQGAAVIVGRGGQFILGHERCLRVRVVCPFELRVERMAQRDRIPIGLARKRVREMGLEVSAFMRHHFHEDVASPDHYDLLVNSATLSPEQVTSLVVEAYRLRFGAAPNVTAAASVEPAPQSDVFPRVQSTGT